MKRTKILAVLLLIAIAAFGQKKKKTTEFNIYASVDSIALMMPDSLTTSTDGIASYINKQFKTQKDKARAIYAWLGTNIEYDVDNMFAFNFYETKEDKIKKSLHTRKGICENYAALYLDICNKINIRSYMVEGFTRQNGIADVLPHVWNAIFIDSIWVMSDATWGAGYVDNGAYHKKLNNDNFLVIPSISVKTHMPFDYLFQFLNYPVTNQEFYQGHTLQDKSKPFFSYVDSLGEYDRQDSTERLIASVNRIERNGVKNSMIFDQLQHRKMKIENDRLSTIAQIYNSAVDEANKGVNCFNEFINYRNKRFIPAKTDAQIKELIDTVAVILNSSKTRLTAIKNPDQSLTANIAQLSKNVDLALAEVKEQQDWLKTYLKKPKASRKMMFYEQVK